MNSTTSWETSDPALDDLWRRCVTTSLNDYGYANMDGRIIAMGPPWLRDHVHELKAYKYFFPDLTSGLEFFFRHRLPDGHFPDFFVPIGDQHESFVAPEWEIQDKPENRVFIRIPCEADLEYLAVEGVHQAWQATGDDDWMAAQIPVLEQGLLAMTSHPKRWNESRGLVMRPFTIDTWDFTHFYDPDDHFKTNCEIRRFDDTTPMCIFHGDNSGLYAATKQLSEMLLRLGERDRAGLWLALGDDIRSRANDLLWGDGFYMHQFHLDEELGRQNDECRRLSLSNPYDMNRGLPTPEMAVSIIESYQRRWEQKRSQYLAEWFTIDSPYEPRFGWYVPGEYVNGGLFPTVGAELAKASFRHGFEPYACDILRRFHDFAVEKNEVGFMYWPDGRGFGGGPAGWCGAAFVSAMLEGLAGIEDRSAVFNDVLLSPRWAAADVERASIRACYPASGASFSYQYSLDEDGAVLACDGAGERLSIHLLMPLGLRIKDVSWNGDVIANTVSAVRESRYLDVDPAGQRGTLRVSYS